MLLTLFGVPKPFAGRFASIQYNAINSWTLLGSECEVVLLGDDRGTAETARELGVDHVAEIPRNPRGVPLLDGIFAAARERASGRILCYVNADIIFAGGLLSAVQSACAHSERFLVTGRRITVPVPERLAFEAGWQGRLALRAEREGVLDPPVALDYFAFTRDVLQQIPPFAIGRTVWDNWLLYKARRDGANLIDATARVTAVHQAHDYSVSTEDVRNGSDAQRNRQLAGGPEYMFSLNDATHELSSEGPPLRSLQPRRIARHALTWPMLAHGWPLPVRLTHHAAYKVLRLGEFVGLRRP